MKTDSSTEPIKRRQFITRGCAAGASLCFGCSHFFSFAKAQESHILNPEQDKYSNNSGMSYEQVFNFAYRDFLIPQLIAVSNQIGRDNFIKILKTATFNAFSQPGLMNRSFANYPNQFMNNVVDSEVLENSPNLRVYKMTRCLWAKIFREADAADIGYAMVCYGDYAIASSNNEKLERETTLMQGHDCCLFRYTKSE